MYNQNYQNGQLPTMVSYKNKPKGSRVSWLSISIVLGLCCLASLGGAAAYTFLYPRREIAPLVLIHAPQNGESLEAGQAVTVRALASDPGKITRVELWVDGQLLEAETSNVSGGISSFPLLTDWQPASPGRHTITVRAFNQRGTRGNSSIRVEVVERVDRDNDGAADDTDLCPDQPGSDISNGCPDRDLDGTPDATDTCPDAAGLPAAGGCPAVTEGDRDGDGTPDVSDACPDAPGSALTGGCTDADGDLVGDAVDLCATEAGAAERAGCSTPGDADGDGVLDDEDICPEEWGLLEHGGCPEIAVAPEDGIESGSGTSDRDGDGAADDVDPCPGEAGSPENDFCPPPDEDPAPSGEPPLFFNFTPLLMRPFVAPAFVQFEALHFEVPMEYQRVWCYAKLEDGEMKRYDFEPGDGLSWNIDEVFGGENSAHVTVAHDTPLDVFAECYGATTLHGLTSNYLGSITRQHIPVEWDGHIVQAESTGGDSGGHSFTVRYHLCSPDCNATALQPPVITNIVADGDRLRLAWNWEGDPRTIEGHKLYLNGNFISTEPGGTSGEIVWWQRDSYCVDHWEFHMTSFAGPNPNIPDVESAPGNTVSWDNIPCQKLIRVTFETLDLHNPPADEGGHHNPGPLTGAFVTAAGANMVTLRFDAVRCYHFPVPPFEDCFGVKLGEGQWNIQEFFDHINTLHDACGDHNLCHGLGFSAPSTDTVTIGVDPGEDLTIRGRINDIDERDEDEVLYNEQATIHTRDLSPDSSLTLPIAGDHLDLIVKVDLYPFEP